MEPQHPHNMQKRQSLFTKFLFTVVTRKRAVEFNMNEFGPTSFWMYSESLQAHWERNHDLASWKYEISVQLILPITSNKTLRFTLFAFRFSPSAFYPMELWRVILYSELNLTNNSLKSSHKSFIWLQWFNKKYAILERRLLLLEFFAGGLNTISVAR